MNTVSLLGICRCSVRVSQAKRGKQWANDKMAGENVKQSKHFSFPVDEVVQTIMEGGSELDGTNHKPTQATAPLRSPSPEDEPVPQLLEPGRGPGRSGPLPWHLPPGHSFCFFLMVLSYCFVSRSEYWQLQLRGKFPIKL